MAKNDNSWLPIIKKPHDYFFRLIIRDPADAYGLLQACAPELAASIPPESMRPAKDTFVSEVFKERAADSVYDVRIQGESSETEASLLFEHKSYPPERLDLALQLLSYHEGYLQGRYRTLSKGQDLPLLIPIVVYHGKGELGDLRLSRQRNHPLPPNLSAYYPDFEPLAFDLNRFDPRGLRRQGYPFLASALLALKYSRDENYLERNFVDIVAFESSEDPRNRSKLTALLHYLALMLKVSKEKFQAMVSTLPAQQATVAKSAFEDIFESGREEGRAEGLSQGLTQGLSQGLSQGRAEGRAEGYQKSSKEKILRLIRLHPEWSDAYIAELLGEEVALVAELRKLS